MEVPPWWRSISSLVTTTGNSALSPAAVTHLSASSILSLIFHIDYVITAGFFFSLLLFFPYRPSTASFKLQLFPHSSSFCNITSFFLFAQNTHTRDQNAAPAVGRPPGGACSIHSTLLPPRRVCNPAQGLWDSGQRPQASLPLEGRRMTVGHNESKKPPGAAPMSLFGRAGCLSPSSLTSPASL